MDYPNHITNHEKGKHLTYENYVVIELRLKDGWTPNAIAKKELHCAPNTVRNIIKKGMTPLYNGKVLRFLSSPRKKPILPVPMRAAVYTVCFMTIPKGEYYSLS